LGVTFRGDSVRARFAEDEFELLASPRYSIEHTPTAALVSIEYSLPTAPGGVSGALGRGVIDLERTPEGRLTPLRRRFVDLRTGSVRTPLHPGTLEKALALSRCPKHQA